MPQKKQFQILTAEGLVTYETFWIAERQPLAIRPGCLLMVDAATGRQVTVHRTRLVPVQQGLDVSDLYPSHKSLCAKCGRVEGIVDDEVICPHHAQGVCGLLQAGPVREVLSSGHRS